MQLIFAGEVSISLDKTLGVGLDLEAEDVILNNTKLDNEQKSSKNKNNNVTGSYLEKK